MHTYELLDGNQTSISTGSGNQTRLSMVSNGEVRDPATSTTVDTLVITYTRTSASFSLEIDDSQLNAGETPTVGSGTLSGDTCPQFGQATRTNHLYLDFFPPPNDGDESLWTFTQGAHPPLKLKVKLKRQG